MSRHDLDIAMVVPGLPFDGGTLEKKSLGGSETAGLCLARSLATLGHHVQMFSNCEKPGKYDGVTYRRLDEFADYGTSAPHDVTVIQRAPELFAGRMNSRLNVLWCHDLAVGRKSDVFRAALWNVDKVAVLSDFMATQYQETYRLPADVLWKTRNGIDLSYFPTEPMPRDRTSLVFGARPERGLDVLLDRVFQTLLMKRSNLRLYLATYGNAVRDLQGFYQHIQNRVAAYGDKVTMLPPLTKRDYYKLLSSVGVYVYPTPSATLPNFAEVSCITAMECQAAGLPIVTSRRGALPETIAPGAGTLIEGDPASDRYLEEFVDAVLKYVRDDDAWAAASEAGKRHAQTLDWSGVAEQWTEDLNRFIAERNTSPRRLVSQMIRRSDIMAAKAVIESASEDLSDLKAVIDAGWSFVESPEGQQEQYEKIGQTHTDVFFQTAEEPRLKLLAEWFREHPEIHRVLDYGCAHGSYAVNLQNQIGREWVGVDIDKNSIRWAEHNRKERGKNPGALEFRVGTHEIDLSDCKPFDALVAFEVLEHVPNPTEVINALERWVKPGGKVLLTVPFGPWEWLSYRTYPHRCHLWEFDLHDIRDLFGNKNARQISIIAADKCEPLGEPLGWHLIEYTVDGTPTGTIDMARKMRLQRPRQTVSLVMIAGPGSEETLGWALAPVRDIVDEIIIGDCGMSDTAKQIAAHHEAKIVPAADPLVHGFEAPRNDALQHARMDWVLWYDTDERLVNVHQLSKYLRDNFHTGYLIQQHNFSCDNEHEATTPVRCFRRGPRADGKSLRWYGMIHEHPEYALDDGPAHTIILRDVHIAHVGYLSYRDQVGRFNRNLPLLRKDRDTYPDRRLQKHFICRDLIQMARWELKDSGGVITPSIEAECREVIKLYREHFLGKGTYLNVDTLQYYSAALTILGQGVDVSFGFESNTTGDLTPNRARFANEDEAKAEMTWRIEQSMRPRLSEWW